MKLLAIKYLLSLRKNSLLKKLLISIPIFILFLLFVPIMKLSAPSLLGNYSDLNESKTYKEIEQIYKEYVESIYLYIDNRVNKVQEEYSYYEHSTEDNTSKFIIPEVIKTESIEIPKIQSVLAYLSTKYLSTDIDTNEITYKINKEKILTFLNNITSITEKITGTDPVYYNVTVTTLTEQEIAEKCFSDEAQQQYLFSYETYLDIKDEIQNEQESSELEIDFDMIQLPENGMSIPLYLQYDPKWGKQPYGNGTLSTSACGPTSFAMIISYFKQAYITPLQVANWSMTHGYYVSGQGTSWSFFEGASKNWGITCKNLGKNSSLVVNALATGQPVIASMSPGIFTKGGHFIVLRGITKEGNILVNDPNDNYSTKNFYKQEFSLSTIVSQSKNFWAFKFP